MPHQCSTYDSAAGDPADYEIRVQVDFEKRLIRPLRVAGVCAEPKSEVLLYAAEKCRPGCNVQGCQKCRVRKLFQDSAGNPSGAVSFQPHWEYLYCLRLDQRQPVTALLSLTPREQNVEVKELGQTAYWFATTFQRGKAETQAAENCEDDGALPQPASVGRVTSVETYEAVISGAAKKNTEVRPVQKPQGTGSGGQHSVNSTSKYLPNLKIIYQVRKELMTVIIPEPSQLTHDLDLILAHRHDPELNPQVATLRPGMSQASRELITERDTPYTLMVQLKNKGGAVKLLDLVTERKVLRVQESLLAPKYMNFLMERRVDQRATFILHITFDEKAIEVDSQMLGEFFLDVDAEKKTLNIGTVMGHANKMYRVERLLGTGSEDLANARRMRVFEGGVDAATLFIKNPISIEKMVDYLITVLDTEGGTELPTSVLSFKKNSLFVKEVKGSDVKLHVTVQRQFDPAAVANANNYLETAAAEQNSIMVVSRSQPDGMFHCPIRDGCSRYRIMHGAARAPSHLQQRRGRATSRSSTSTTAAAVAAAAAATEEAVAAADASCYSSGGVSAASGPCVGGTSSCDDSGFGRAPSSLTESLDSCQWQMRQQRLQQRVMEAAAADEEQQQQHQRDFNVSLDVDLPSLLARLLPSDVADNLEDVGSDDGGCYMIVEEQEGRIRSIPCQLGQSFSVKHWCRYTVKSIGDSRVTPLFTFRLTDSEVTDIWPCNPNVRLSKNICQK